MLIEVTNSVPVARTPRLLQLGGLFDLPLSERSEQTYRVDLPIENFPWNVGLIVGPSGSGKSTLARATFGDKLISTFDWPADKSLVDGFPVGMGIKEITGLLSSVGFSSPPSWVRPFRCLSNGEQFRATLARAMAESPDLAVIDEFTSVVDRTVAQIGSAAVSKSVRRAGRRLVAVSCHYDIVDWLDPDWIVEMPSGTFTRRQLRQRPAIDLEIVRAHPSAWSIFKNSHYLTADLHKSAACFVALVNDRPAAFASVIHMVGYGYQMWREHRTVCLPDFQGIGIGNALSEFVASLYVCTGKAFRSTTGNPAMIQHRTMSALWKMVRPPSLRRPDSSKGGVYQTRATNRLTSSFEYVGPARSEEAIRLGVI